MNLHFFTAPFFIVCIDLLRQTVAHEMRIVLLDLTGDRADFSIADRLSVDGEDRDDAVLRICEEDFFRIHHIFEADRICRIIDGGDTGSRSDAGKDEGAGDAAGHEFIRARGPDDARLDDKDIRVGGFGQKAVSDEDAVVAALLQCVLTREKVIHLREGKNVAVMAAIIFHRDALHAVLHFGNGIQTDRFGVDQDIRTQLISGRDQEIMIALSAGDDDLHIAFFDAAFFDDGFHDLGEFVRCCHGTNAQKAHGAVQTVGVIGKSKRMAFVDADPFIASVTKLESSVICRDDLGEIIIEIVIVVYGSFSFCHTSHLRNKLLLLWLMRDITTGAFCLLIACERGSAGSIGSRGSKGVGAAHKNIEVPQSMDVAMPEGFLKSRFPV